MSVRFFTEGVRFSLPKQRKTSSWLNRVAESEGTSIAELNIIFCSDQFLSAINLKYLRHKSLTDIITFDLGSTKKGIKAEIYISKPRVEENSSVFGTTLDNEIHRVMVHGLLHLLGYGDKTPRQKAKMRKKEDAYLSLRTGSKGST